MLVDLSMVKDVDPTLQTYTLNPTRVLSHAPWHIDVCCSGTHITDTVMLMHMQ